MAMAGSIVIIKIYLNIGFSFVGLLAKEITKKENPENSKACMKILAKYASIHQLISEAVSITSATVACMFARID